MSRCGASAVIGSLRTRLRTAGGRVIRRFGPLPGGTPDGLGEDAQLTEASLDADVLVYFPDTLDAIYQLEQWLPAMRALHRARPVVIVVRDSRVAKRLRQSAGLPVVAVGQLATLEGLIRRSRLRVALYVAHSPANFQLLRFPSLAHVSLLHGDSDKTVTVSNQIKAYDFAFVAGRAALDRARANLSLFDTDRLLLVGRPGLDAERLEQPATANREGSRRVGRRRTVLYAPTWEGAQVTASYGSVASHGERIVRALLDGPHRVIYRPHPLTGARLPEVGDADRRIRQAVAGANASHPAAGHRVDLDVPVTESFGDADLLICDVSAMSVEWLPTGRPLIITVPDTPDAIVAGTALERTVPRLGVADLGRIAAAVDRELGEDPTRAQRLALIEYYLGDVTPGASVRSFVASVDQVIERHGVEWARATANGAVGP